MNHKSHSISITIDAPAATVFRIASDFNNYHSWNTIIPSAKGDLIEGQEIKMLMNMGGKSRPFNPSVTSIVENKSFTLAKTFLSKSIGELTHTFEFNALSENRTELIQQWEGKGFLVKMMWSKISEGFADFEVFNTDFKKHISSI